MQDIRLGGLMTRLRSCCDRLTDYRDGKLDCIPELEEALQPLYTGQFRFTRWQNTVTVNTL